MPHLLGLTQSSFDPASRFRFIQFIPEFERAGWHVDHRPNRPDRQWSPKGSRLVRGAVYRAGRAVMRWNRMQDIRESGRFNAVFVNRDLAGGAGEFERRLLATTDRIIFDFDDAIFLGKRGETITRSMCERASWVTPGNAYLAEFASRYAERVTVIPTVIDTDRCAARDWTKDVERPLVRVGWSGSDQSIGSTLIPHLPVIEAAQRRAPFELVVISNSAPSLPAGIRWRFQRWTADGEQELRNAFDVGIMPLKDDTFQRGKCALKLLQYMAAGLPTVGSPVGVNEQVILHGTTGLHARSEAEWVDAICTLVADGALRRRMGEAGRARCEADYSVGRWFPELERIARWVADRSDSAVA